MTSSTTRRRPARTALQLAACGLLGAALCSCTRSPNSQAAGNLAFLGLTTPLSTSLIADSGSWVAVRLGELSSLQNTFWELFYKPAKGTKWSLVTPPGVADNGGLTLARSASGDPVLVGFEPSQLLKSSPLAETADGGQTWSPGILQQELAPVPDALAVLPGGTVVALVRQSGGELFQSRGGISAWSRVATLSDIARSGGGKACVPGALTATAAQGNGT